MTKRVIVEIKRQAAPEAGGTGGAGLAQSLGDMPGLKMDQSYGPVPLEGGSSTAPRPEAGTYSALDRDPGDTVLVRGEVEEGDEDKLKKAPGVVAVWSDAEIVAYPEGAELIEIEEDETPFDFDSFMEQMRGTQVRHDAGPVMDLQTATPCAPTDCDPRTAKGTLADAAKFLRCDRLWRKGIKGAGVTIGIVDTGVDKTKVPNVVGGWTPDDNFPPGTDPGGHGSMCATDALGMAPEAKIYDIGVLKSRGGIAGTISDAIRAYQWALEKFREDGTPQILSNSWGMYQKSWAPDYATDPNHPFTRKTVEVINAGILVTFAAGNCGQVCPSGRCGADSGPGRSIWGANGHPRVMTIGAANIREEWIGYTSQGPAALDPKKPDFCGMSHFKGFFASDTGTSAACPTVSGVLALLRSHDPALKQDEAKKALAETAKDLCGDGWDRNSGHGIVNAEAAFNKLNLFETPLTQASWIHGHSAHAEHPDRLTSGRHLGFYSLFNGKPGSFNWFHMAIPTPVIVNRRRLRLDSVMLMFVTDPDVVVRSVHVYDGHHRIQSINGLEMSGSHLFERFDVLDRRIRYGVGVSIGVEFKNGEGNRRVAFISGGGDFIA